MTHEGIYWGGGGMAEMRGILRNVLEKTNTLNMNVQNFGFVIPSPLGLPYFVGNPVW